MPEAAWDTKGSIGAEGTGGVLTTRACDAGPSPTALVILAVNVYVVPAVSPVTAYVGESRLVATTPSVDSYSV